MIPKPPRTNVRFCLFGSQENDTRGEKLPSWFSRLPRFRKPLSCGNFCSAVSDAHGTVYLLFIVLSSASWRTPNETVRLSSARHSSLTYTPVVMPVALAFASARPVGSVMPTAIDAVFGRVDVSVGKLKEPSLLLGYV